MCLIIHQNFWQASLAQCGTYWIKDCAKNPIQVYKSLLLPTGTHVHVSQRSMLPKFCTILWFALSVLLQCCMKWFVLLSGGVWMLHKKSAKDGAGRWGFVGVQCEAGVSKNVVVNVILRVKPWIENFLKGRFWSVESSLIIHLWQQSVTGVLTQCFPFGLLGY